VYLKILLYTSTHNKVIKILLLVTLVFGLFTWRILFFLILAQMKKESIAKGTNTTSHSQCGQQPKAHHRPQTKSTRAITWRICNGTS
jgi:hypothetical protein